VVEQQKKAWQDAPLPHIVIEMTVANVPADTGYARRPRPCDDCEACKKFDRAEDPGCCPLAMKTFILITVIVAFGLFISLSAAGLFLGYDRSGWVRWAQRTFWPQPWEIPGAFEFAGVWMKQDGFDANGRPKYIRLSPIPPENEALNRAMKENEADCKAHLPSCVDAQ